MEIELSSFQLYLVMAVLVSGMSVLILYMYYAKYKYIVESRRKHSILAQHKSSDMSSSDENVSILPLKH